MSRDKKGYSNFGIIDYRLTIDEWLKHKARLETCKYSDDIEIDFPIDIGEEKEQSK